MFHDLIPTISPAIFRRWWSPIRRSILSVLSLLSYPRRQRYSSIIADFVSAIGDVGRPKYNSLVNENRYSDRIRRLVVCILMNSLSNLVFQWRKFLREDKEKTKERKRQRGREREVTGSGSGGNDGEHRERRRGEPEPEMAARWLLLLALLAAHAAALPDFIRIGEYLSPGVKATTLSTAFNGVSKIIINVSIDNIHE